MFGSNYTQTTIPYKQTVIIPFYQPPTIQFQAPSVLNLDVSAPLYIQFAATSTLSTQPLHYSNLKTSPETLSGDLTLDEASGVISGSVSVDTISAILDLNDPPSISVHVTDEYGGFVVYVVTLAVQESPPIFDQEHYVFSVREEQTSDEFAGSFALIDPNGDLFNFLPRIVNLSSSASDLFLIVVGDQFGHFSTYDVFGTRSFDFEEITAYYMEIEANDGFQTSRVSVRVDVLPVNEFDPAFTPPQR